MPRFLTRSAKAPLGQRFSLNSDSMQAAGLVQWLPTLGLSRGTGVLRDRTERGGNAAFAGSLLDPTWVDDPFSGSSLLFDGGNDRLNVAAGADPGGATAWTLSIWMFRTSAAVTKGVYGWYDGTNGLFLHTAVSGDGFLVLAGGASSFSQVTFTTLNIWTNCVLVYDGSQSTDATRLKLYANGSQLTLGAFGAAVPSSIPALSVKTAQLGDVGSLSRFFGGQLADARSYNRAFSPQEAYQLWAPETRWELYRLPKLRTIVQAPANAYIRRQRLTGGMIDLVGGLRG